MEGHTWQGMEDSLWRTASQEMRPSIQQELNLASKHVSLEVVLGQLNLQMRPQPWPAP